MKIGFVGTGLMGRPMAGHLQAGGHELYLVQHRSPLPPELLAGGAVVCVSRKEVASRADLTFTMLPATADVENALFGAEGVAEGLSPGKTVVADTAPMLEMKVRRFMVSGFQALPGRGCRPNQNVVFTPSVGVTPNFW